jgi:pyruvate/2-oxoglutarate dehydrogenase complex dihydrolipoamide dehydrogenase (E3) component
MEIFDAIVIGAGQAGGPISTALANAGRKTAIIEHKYVGGSCINWGCTPTKTMVASAESAYMARRSADFGVHTGPVTIDQRQVRQRKTEIVEDFRSGTLRRIENSPSELIRGQACFSGTKQITISLNDSQKERQLQAETIIINTGARPRLPKLEGLDTVNFLDSTSIMELEETPEHLLVLGGGYIGLEFGQMFRRFGSQVTIIQRGGQLLPREDGDIAQAVLEILQEDGLEILLSAEASRVQQDERGQLQLQVQAGGQTRTLTGSHLLVGVGRIPNTDRLNPAASGVATGSDGHIQVNDFLETNVPGIYAVGDVKGGPAFTHISYDDFRVLKTNLLEGGRMSIRNRLVPYTVYMDPQLGRIGLTEKEARQGKHNFKVAKMPMSYVARAIETGRTRGLMKALVDPDTEKILGAAILGTEGGEIMSMIEIAMLGNLPYTTLRDAIFSHPSLAESLNNLFASFED